MERKLEGIALILFGTMLGMFSANINGIFKTGIPFVSIGILVAIFGIVWVFVPKKE